MRDLTPLALCHTAEDWSAEVWMTGPDGDELQLVEVKFLGHEIPLSRLTAEHRRDIAEYVFEQEYVG